MTVRQPKSLPSSTSSGYLHNSNRLERSYHGNSNRGLRVAILGHGFYPILPCPSPSLPRLFAVVLGASVASTFPALTAVLYEGAAGTSTV